MVASENAVVQETDPASALASSNKALVSGQVDVSRQLLEFSRPWVPAPRAAGLEHRPPYSMRHTFASNAIAAGIATFEIARVMGTSVVQIEKTYGHLLPDAIDRARLALDAWETRQAVTG